MNASRYSLLKLNNGKWLCADALTGITVSWDDRRFNETQEATINNDTNLDVSELAKAMREMSDYLRTYHYNKVF